MNIESGLQGRRALVTGSSSGIGFETAAMLAEAGVSHIVINGRSRHRGEAARQAILDRARDAEVAFVAGDVSSPNGARSLIESAARHLGGTIEILVNAAGGEYTPRLFHQTSVEEIDAIIGHWLLSTLYCCHYALPLMPDAGAIVNVASDAAKVPTPGEAVIGGAMAGIAMFSRTLAMEAKRRKIRVNVVTPSLVRGTLTYDRLMADSFSRKLFEKAIERAHLGIPEAAEVAATVLFLLRPHSSRLTGQVISVNGGISAG
jgi:NAD(P)-dependent dehydrogenase (short-subunit alcohol dehydrogenase family)